MGRSLLGVCVTVLGCRCVGPLDGCCEAAEGPLGSSRLGSISRSAGVVGVLGSLLVSGSSGLPAAGEAGGCRQLHCTRHKCKHSSLECTCWGWRTDGCMEECWADRMPTAACNLEVTVTVLVGLAAADLPVPLTADKAGVSRACLPLGRVLTLLAVKSGCVWLCRSLLFGSACLFSRHWADRLSTLLLQACAANGLVGHSLLPQPLVCVLACDRTNILGVITLFGGFLLWGSLLVCNMAAASQIPDVELDTALLAQSVNAQWAKHTTHSLLKAVPASTACQGVLLPSCSHHCVLGSSPS